MTYPKKFDREKEPMRDILQMVLNRENYKEKDGELQPLHISFGRENQAKYVRERIYTLFRLIRREFERKGVDTPNHPMITQKEQVLSFTWKEHKSRVQWEVVKDD